MKKGLCFDFVAFISKTVNVSLQTTKKRSKLETRVGTTDVFLSVKDLTVISCHVTSRVVHHRAVIFD